MIRDARRHATWRPPPRSITKKGAGQTRIADRPGITRGRPRGRHQICRDRQRVRGEKAEKWPRGTVAPWVGRRRPTAHETRFRISLLDRGWAILRQTARRLPAVKRPRRIVPQTHFSLLFHMGLICGEHAGSVPYCRRETRPQSGLIQLGYVRTRPVRTYQGRSAAYCALASCNAGDSLPRWVSIRSLYQSRKSMMPNSKVLEYGPGS